MERSSNVRCERTRRTPKRNVRQTFSKGSLRTNQERTKTERSPDVRAWFVANEPGGNQNRTFGFGSRLVRSQRVNQNRTFVRRSRMVRCERTRREPQPNVRQTFAHGSLRKNQEGTTTERSVFAGSWSSLIYVACSVPSHYLNLTDSQPIRP